MKSEKLMGNAHLSNQEKPLQNSSERFSGTLGEEYDLLLKAYPHYAQLQNSVGKNIAETFKNRDIKKIQVLEIGFGTGITTEVLLDSDKRIQVIAIDNEEKMLDQAREKLSQLEAKERVNLVIADALTHLEHTPNDSLDAVASVFVLHNFNKEFRQKIIEQIYRVLKPNGLFVNGDKYAADDDEIHKKSYDTQVKRYDVYDDMDRSDYKKEWLEHLKEDEANDVIFKEGQAKEQLKLIGFKDIKLIYRDTMEATISAMK